VLAWGNKNKVNEIVVFEIDLVKIVDLLSEERESNLKNTL